MSKKKAMALAVKTGCQIEDDGITISVIAPAGKHDGCTTHELMTEINRFPSKEQAWKAVCEDIQTDWVDCELTDCEWCV
jgi:hypothetical protein